MGLEIGSKYNKLTVVEDLGMIKKGNKKRHYYICCCECGSKTKLIMESIKSGHTKSCGCIYKSEEYKKNKKTFYHSRENRY